jgi:hypothetical protein
MKYRATIILFLISFLLGGLYFFYLEPSSKAKKLIEDFESRFFRADTSDIEFLRLDAGRGPITISKSGQSWEITKPAKYVPDLGAIESLFKALAKGRLIKMVGNAEDIDQFGFETTHIILSLGYKGTIDVLRIAGESPSAIGHYAFSERLGKIFLVNKEFVTAMNLKPLDLREKRLFLFENDELDRIRIVRKEDTVELEKRGDGWHMVSPAAMRTSRDEIENLIETLHTQKAEAFVEWKPELVGIEKKLSIELHDVKGISLGNYNVYYRGTEWDKGILAHRSGLKDALRVRRDFWILLDSKYSDFAYRNMIKIDQQKAQRIRITTEGHEYLIEQKEGLWRYNGFIVDDKKIMELTDSLNAWKAEKLIYENRDLGKEQFLLEVEYEEDTERIAVTNFNMDYEISGAMMFAAEEGTLKKKKIDYWYASSSNLDSYAIVRSLDLKNIINIVKVLSNE